ncbi:MAG: DUF1592 domain-containing protein, partial [Planctomycetota bacterium]|nr:DUF1592 domain-containing protein [Planctomycetota bacterium]
MYTTPRTGPPPQAPFRACWALLLASFLAVDGLAADETPSQTTPADDSTVDFAKRVEPLLTKFCHDCHSGEMPEGNFSIADLRPEFGNAKTQRSWELIETRLLAGEMPPRDKPRPSPGESRAITDWIRIQSDHRDQQRQAQEGRVPRRRLNRVEYENTIRDLLGIFVDYKDLLPPDSEAAGFDNVADGQHVSSFLMECYLEAAERGLDLAIANRPQPKRVKQRYLCRNQHLVKNPSEDVFRQEEETTVFFTSSPWQAMTLSEFYPPDRGRYHFRISASSVQSDERPLSYRVLAGPLLMATRNHLVGYLDAPAGEPGVEEFSVDLEARSTINILPYGLASANVVKQVGAKEWTGPGVAIHWVEVDGPIHNEWPPASHRALLGDLPQIRIPDPQRGDRFEVSSTDPETDTRRILSDFARRAFRRQVDTAEIEPYVALVLAQLEKEQRFEPALRAGLAAILVSPDFLFLRERPGRLDPFALASRLSYFLWSTMPDAELLSLAEQGGLDTPEALRQQVERMLNHPHAARFAENFVGQWLGLRNIEVTDPTHYLYPEYDDLLKVSMVRETELFFAELFKEDASVLNFVASDFSMLNERLAKHYQIPGVVGMGFRKVELPPGSHRGGVLTMASVLKVTANGTTTSPVVRGAWVLDKILGSPPPKPPADITAIEPDTRGSTTIREQLQKHRNTPQCAACHITIDPPGFALESFDVIGGWRDHYRTTGLGQPVEIDGRRMHYLKGPKVDPSAELADGSQFADIDEFKRLLLR